MLGSSFCHSHGSELRLGRPHRGRAHALGRTPLLGVLLHSVLRWPPGHLRHCRAKRADSIARAWPASWVPRQIVDHHAAWLVVRRLRQVQKLRDAMF